MLSQDAGARLTKREVEEPKVKGHLGRNVLLSGMASGIIEGTLMQPLEFLKTRLQINEGRPVSLGMALREALQQGGIKQLYRGGLPEISGMLPRSTAALATLELSKRGLASLSPEDGGRLKAWHAYAAGGASGVAESLGFAPFQVIKVRMAAVEHMHRYRNSIDCVSQLLREEGPRALLNGLGPTLWRVVTWNSIYYGAMHQLQVGYLDNHPLSNPVLTAARKLSLGVVVGVGATVFNSPFDVVKSRVQSQLPGQVKYRYTFPSIFTIVREEGFMALYKGFMPKALRLGLGQTVGYMVFTEMLQRLNTMDEQEKENAV